jgi:hypothetical protein
MVFEAARQNQHSKGPSDSIESVTLVGSEVPFRVCWGDHVDKCAIGPSGFEAGHGPVAEIDYDNAEHRRVLRWLRRLDPEHARLYAIPHPETLVRRPKAGSSGPKRSNGMEKER